jgi:FkbM family methyltransferase
MYIVDQKLKNFTKIDPEFFFTLSNTHQYWVDRFPENDQIQWMCETFGGPGIALDVGAHCGTWTVALSKAFTQVFSFEPNPRVFNNLCANLALRDLSNVDARRCCLSSENKKSTYFFRSEDGGGNGIEPLDKTIDSSCVQMEVETTTLDTIIEKMNKKITFIKIDVEGHELDVLKGASRIISRDSPPIVVESWVSWRERDGIPAIKLRKELFSYLDSIRYTVRPINGHDEMFLCTR